MMNEYLNGLADLFAGCPSVLMDNEKDHSFFLTEEQRLAVIMALRRPVTEALPQWIPTSATVPSDDTVLFVARGDQLWVGWRDLDGSWYSDAVDGRVSTDEHVSHWMLKPTLPSPLRQTGVRTTENGEGHLHGSPPLEPK